MKSAGFRFLVLCAGFALMPFLLAKLPSSWRIDVTKDKVFSLSPPTQRFLTSLKKEVVLTLYLSPSLGRSVPSYGLYVQHVKDTLKAFQRRSRGYLKVHILNPEPFSENEDRALQEGLESVPLGGEEIYFGLVASQAHVKDHHIIPFFQEDREPFLEYDLVRLLYILTHPRKPVVAVIAGADVFGHQEGFQGGVPEPWASLAQLSKLFHIQPIATPLELKSTRPDALLVIHPVNLTQAMLYAIDQYMLAGGVGAFFVDPWFENAVGSPLEPEALRASNLTKLFQTWGLSIPKGLVVADKTLGHLVKTDISGHTTTLPYLSWLDIQPEGLNKRDPMTSSLESLILPSAGVIRIKPLPGVHVTPLISSTKESALLPTKEVAKNDVLKVLNHFVADGHQKVLAVRVSGHALTAFPKLVQQQLRRTTKRRDMPLSRSLKPFHAVVVADADMLEDRFWAQRRFFLGKAVTLPFADNGAFLMNILDHLTGTDTLMALRARRTGVQPFKRIVALQRAATFQYRAKEESLQKKLKSVQQDLQDLRSTSTLSSVQKEHLTHLTQQILHLRHELRSVNVSLRRALSHLKQRLLFVNIALVPLLLTLFALVFFAFRSWRRRFYH